MQTVEFVDGVRKPIVSTESPSPWPEWQRVAFRFCFVYFGLYCLSTQIIQGPFTWVTWDIPEPMTLPPLRQLVFWVGAHVFHFELPLVYDGTGSGDTAYAWTFLAMLLAFSMVVTLVWSALDRKRENYETLWKWFRVGIRFLLAGQLLSYGFAKLFPMQMPFPNLYRLVEPFGSLSPMGVLWASIGASPAYEMFAGSAEVAAGLLLIAPRTAMLGALLAAADMTQVFMLNMTYDVPVKQLSFHLLLMSLFLLAPDAKRLAQFFFTDRAIAPERVVPLFRKARANRIALWAQLALGVWLLVLNISGGIAAWKLYGPGQPRSPLYGIWNVQTMTLDGTPRSLDAMSDEAGRWRRLLFDQPESATLQRWPSDELARCALKLDPDKKTIELTRAGKAAHFTYDRSGPDTLSLDGDIDGKPAHLTLKRQDETKMLLLSRGFHWRQDFPYNR